MKKKYSRPILIKAVVYIEDNLSNTSIVTGRPDSVPLVQDETVQTGDGVVEWDFN